MYQVDFPTKCQTTCTLEGSYLKIGWDTMTKLHTDIQGTYWYNILVHVVCSSKLSGWSGTCSLVKSTCIFHSLSEHLWNIQSTCTKLHVFLKDHPRTYPGNYWKPRMELYWVRGISLKNGTFLKILSLLVNCTYKNEFAKSGQKRPSFAT